MDKNVSFPQLPDQIISPAMDQQFAFPVIDVTQKSIHNRRQWGTYKQKRFVQERLYLTSKEAYSLRIIEFP